jgi:hypothetical protein
VAELAGLGFQNLETNRSPSLVGHGRFGCPPFWYSAPLPVRGAKPLKKILWIAGAGLALACLAWVVNGVAEVREVANRVSCGGHLFQIETQLQWYHEKYGHFPPAYQVDASGKPAHSWRMLLMLWDEPKLFADYRLDEPWNSPNNIKLESLMPKYFQCDSDKDPKNRWHTNYFVVVGKETLFPGPKALSLKDLGKPPGSTILLVEATGLGVHWMEPRDLEFDTMSFEINDPTRPSLSARHRFPNFKFADGTSGYSGNLSPDQFREMLRIQAPGR